jgi:hypothetical protein
MTIEDVFIALGNLTRRQVRGEISEAEANEEQQDLMLKACAEMTNDELDEIQRVALYMHHLLAKVRSEVDNLPVPGNDPLKPN